MSTKLEHSRSNKTNKLLTKLEHSKSNKPGGNNGSACGKKGSANSYPV
jgi:hypothetical protein